MKCKAKEYWFTLQTEGTQEVRVKMKDYGFFVPRNADGDTIVEGISSKRVQIKKM